MSAIQIQRTILILVVAMLIRLIGKIINSKIPANGINESMYIEVNGSKQWISIYGKNKDNPVLLYLHGGPGASTSAFDYAITRKWADVYTVVTWDQRQTGKSYDGKSRKLLTKDLLLSDAKIVTEFILKYLSKEKLTILGHSWGSIYGANLVQLYPEYYECFIGTGQLVDSIENEESFIQEALLWTQNDSEVIERIHKLNPTKLTVEYLKERNELMNTYGYGMLVNGRDYNLALTMLFNPYYSLIDWIKTMNIDMHIYYKFLCSEEFTAFSLKDKTEYHVPYYNINGDRDYQTNYKLAKVYFDQIKAPNKRMFIMKNMTHGLLEVDSTGFSELVHQIKSIEDIRKGELL